MNKKGPLMVTLKNVHKSYKTGEIEVRSLKGLI